MKNPIQMDAEDWQSNAIKQCMRDPEYAARVNAGEWCATCDMSRPCLCDKDAIIADMREFYEKHRRTWWGRREPKLIGSWGRDMDGLMTGLYKIATRKLK